MDSWRRFLVIAASAGMLAFLLTACGQSGGPAPDNQGSGPSDGTNSQEPEFNAEEYFQGRTIRLMTSSNPGGETDLRMRVLASRISSFIPGNPRIIASNVPPHVVGKNYIYQANSDGLTMGLFSTSMLWEEDLPGAVYDSSRLTYIADLGDSNYVLTIRGELPYTSIQDMAGASGPALRMVTGRIDVESVEPLLLGNMLIAEFLRIPLEVTRKAGRETGPVPSALDQGEADWHTWSGTEWRMLPAVRPGWLSDGYLIPVLGWASGGGYTANKEKPEMDFPHLDQFLSEEQQDMFQGLVHSALDQARPVVMPPDVGEGPRDALRDAFRAAFHDEGFCADWEQLTGSACEWTDGEVVQQRVAKSQPAKERWGDQYDTISAEMLERYVQ